MSIVNIPYDSDAYYKNLYDKIISREIDKSIGFSDIVKIIAEDDFALRNHLEYIKKNGEKLAFEYFVDITNILSYMALIHNHKLILNKRKKCYEIKDGNKVIHKIKLVNT